MIELHVVENPACVRPAEEDARLLIIRGIRALEQAKDELSNLGASRRAPLVDALADFDALDTTVPGLRPCQEIRELLEQVLCHPTERRRRLRIALRRVTRARALALDLLATSRPSGARKDDDTVRADPRGER